jgi:hypothetical protein
LIQKGLSPKQIENGQGKQQKQKAERIKQSYVE